jgi:hypothetical protein
MTFGLVPYIFPLTPPDDFHVVNIESAEGIGEVDVVVFATGFYTNKVLSLIAITGRGGVDVRDYLDNRPSFYNGVALQDYTDLMDREAPEYVWNKPGVNSWFPGGADTPAVVAARELVDVWHDSKEPDLATFSGS